MCIILLYLWKTVLFWDLTPCILVHFWVCDITFYKCKSSIHCPKNLRSHVVLKCISKIKLNSHSQRRHSLTDTALVLIPCTEHILWEVCVRKGRQWILRNVWSLTWDSSMICIIVGLHTNACIHLFFYLRVWGSLRPTCRSTSPLLIFLNTVIASECVRPCSDMPFTARISSPEKWWVVIVSMLQWLNIRVLTYETVATIVWGPFNKTHLLWH
jgi:hypothetical protein